MDKATVAMEIFARMIHAYLIDENAKAKLTQADKEKMVREAFTWAEIFVSEGVRLKIIKG
jgi:hypothetical protein